MLPRRVLPLAALCVASLALGAPAVAVSSLQPASPQPASSRQSGVSQQPVSSQRPVTARFETESNFDDEAGANANADDPAIYVPRSGGEGFVVGVLKEGGLSVFDLRGRTIQRLIGPAVGEDLAPSRFNNVDLVYGARIGRHRMDLAVVSDRGRDRLRIYAIEPGRRGGPLREVTAPGVPRAFTATEAAVEDQETTYGLASATDRDGRAWVWTSRRHRTEIGLFQLVPGPRGTVTYRRARTIALPERFTLPDGRSWTPCDEPGVGPQVEGMVVDRVQQVLFVAQEDVGIWRIPATLAGRPRLIEKVREFGVPGTYDAETEECTPGADPGFGGEHIAADVEGLTIYERSGGRGYLLAASQGDSTFSVFDRRSDRHLASFAVGGGRRADSVEHSDGSMVVNVPVAGFPQGLFVTHDGENTPASTGADGEVRENTNFKYVAWPQIAQRLGLAIEPAGADPRDSRALRMP